MAGELYPELFQHIQRFPADIKSRWFSNHYIFKSYCEYDVVLTPELKLSGVKPVCWSRHIWRGRNPSNTPTSERNKTIVYRQNPSTAAFPCFKSDDQTSRNTSNTPISERNKKSVYRQNPWTSVFPCVTSDDRTPPGQQPLYSQPPVLPHHIVRIGIRVVTRIAYKLSVQFRCTKHFVGTAL